MAEFYSKLEEYFLSVYDYYPSEIKTKMKNLLFVDTVSFIGWVFIFFVSGLANYIESPFDLITLFRDFSVFGLILGSLILIKEREPLMAGYATMSILFMIVIHPLLMDMVYIYSSSKDMLYKTLTILIIGVLFISAYSIKRVQIIVYSIISGLILITHFIILMINFYGGRITFESISMLFESIFFIIITSTISSFLFGLTLRSRIEVIDNIIFYKMSEKGPIPLFFEHSASYNLLIESGVYFYTAIGQGVRYRTGLFGPIPFGEEMGSVSLIYSAIVRDSDFEGSRLKGKNYIMVAFLGNEKDMGLIERDKVIEIIDDEIKKIRDLAKFKEEDFQDFISSLRTH